MQQVAASEARTEIYKQLGVELTTTEGAKGETSLEMVDETILEESGPLATRLLGVAIKEEVVDEEYIPYKTQKMTKALTGKSIQMKKTIHEKSELESAEVVDLCSSDEEMGDVSEISTTVVKEEEEEEECNEDDDDDSDDDAECAGESSEDSSDDKFGIPDLKQIYEEHFEGDKEQKMDTTEETEGTEGLRQTGKAGAKSTIKVKKSEKSRVAAGIMLYEPPMMRQRASSTMPEKVSEHLLEQLENLEAEELQKVTEIAEKARITPQPMAKNKQKKTPPARMLSIQGPEYMETGDIEGPASDQITPGEVSIIADMYTADMSMEEINLRNVLLEPKKWKLDNLDEIYSMLDHYCELQRIHKSITHGNMQESEFRAGVAERVGQFQMIKVLMEQRKQRELEQEKHKPQK